MENKQHEMTGKPKRILLVAVITALIGVIIFLKQRQDAAQPYRHRQLLPVPGRSAPNFTLPQLKGGIVSLSDYTGKVVSIYGPRSVNPAG